jgi:hypothetical protein
MVLLPGQAVRTLEHTDKDFLSGSREWMDERMNRAGRVIGVVIYVYVAVWLSNVMMFQGLLTCYVVSSITLE